MTCCRTGAFLASPCPARGWGRTCCRNSRWCSTGWTNSNSGSRHHGEDAAAMAGMRLAPGTRIGGYEIVALAGAGGMGEVYRARDPRLHRDVAIKVLPEQFA